MGRMFDATGDRDGLCDTTPAAGARSLQNSQPFSHDRKILRFDVPRFEFGIQRFEADALVMPLVLAGLNLPAGILLDGIPRSLVYASEPLDQQNLVLARSH